MKKDEIIAKINDTSGRISDLQNDKIGLLAKLAETVSPYRVGEIVDTKGYSYRGSKCKISRISAQPTYNGKFELHVNGNVLKANGEEGARQCDWDEKIS
ncbi:MAG: hypothetical protein WA003_15745 [Desulfuromonadaceae bacterium]